MELDILIADRKGTSVLNECFSTNLVPLCCRSERKRVCNKIYNSIQNNECFLLCQQDNGGARLHADGIRS